MFRLLHYIALQAKPIIVIATTTYINTHTYYYH
jgi:hypothetical protein